MTPDRAVVQSEGPYWYRDGDPRKANSKPPGTVAWSEHIEAWDEYARRGHGDQSALRVHERGGFGYHEITALLGHEPATWERQR